MKVFLVAFFAFLSCLVLAKNDLYNDRMLDGWQNANGLNENDPTDAFCDYDDELKLKGERSKHINETITIFW